jgi:hypothetical protein
LYMRVRTSLKDKNIVDKERRHPEICAMPDRQLAKRKRRSG